MRDLIEEFIGLQDWAVVGFSSDRRKFGNRIHRDLKEAGYRVYPVNPRGGEVDGEAVYPDVASLPSSVQVADFVVPPETGLQVMRECAQTGLKRIWLQPGAESPELIALAGQLGLQVVHGACVMVEKRSFIR